MFLTLSLDISRTSCHMKVSDGLFFWKFNALSFEPNLCWTQNSPLMLIQQKFKMNNAKTEAQHEIEFVISKNN